MPLAVQSQGSGWGRTDSNGCDWSDEELEGGGVRQDWRQHRATDVHVGDGHDGLLHKNGLLLQINQRQRVCMLLPEKSRATSTAWVSASITPCVSGDRAARGQLPEAVKGPHEQPLPTDYEQATVVILRV